MNDRIFGVGYRRLDDSNRHKFAPWPIARTALQLAWRRRATKIALVFCFGGLVVHGAWLVAQVLMRSFDGSYGGGSGDGGLSPDAGMLAEATFGSAREVLSAFIESQFFLAAVAMAVVAAGFVADDRHAGAFDLYFARPLTRRDYALGKCMAAAALPVGVLALPALLLWIVAVGGTDAAHGRDLWRLGLPTIGSALTATIWLTGVMIGFSSLGERSRTVGATFIGTLFGLMAFGEALPAAGHAWGGYLSPLRDLRTLTQGLLEVGAPSVGGALLSRGGALNDSTLLSFLALLVQAGAGFFALDWRLRREVVG